MRLPQRSAKAFTLIELIVVVVILGILALIAIPTFGKVIGKSQDSSLLTTLRAMGRDAQALRALDQSASWGSAPVGAVSETSYSSAGSAVQAAGAYRPTIDSGVDPAPGEVTYQVASTGEGLVLAGRSASGRICMVGLTFTSMAPGTCAQAATTVDTSGKPLSTMSVTVQSNDTLLPAGTPKTSQSATAAPIPLETVTTPAPAVSADAVTPTTASLPLPTIAGATSYDVRYTSDQTTWKQINNIPATQTTVPIDGLTTGTRYTYQVRGSDTTTTGSWTEPSTFTTPKTDAPKIIYSDAFYDAFNGTAGTNLNNRLTQDKSSTWQVWTGAFEINNNNNLRSPLFSSPRNVAVVRTSAHDADIYMADADGFESVIVRGSDPKNYIAVGGLGNWDTFGIIKVENGVETTLMSGKLDRDANIRVVTEGTTIKVYKVADANASVSGVTPTFQASTTFNQTDPSATYYGAGVINTDTIRAEIWEFSFKKLG